MEAGLAASLARPGGNVTGIQTLQPQLAAKQLSLLKEAIPRLSRSGILFEGVQPGPIGLAFAHEAEVAAKALGIALQSLRINGANELDAAFAAFRAQRSGAVVVMRGAYLTTHMKTLVDIALKHRLPSISEPSNFARLGGLMVTIFAKPNGRPPRSSTGFYAEPKPARFPFNKRRSSNSSST